MVDSGFEKVLGGYAGSALGAGLLSICFNPLFIFSAISIVSTFAGTVAIIRSKDVRAAAERRQYLVVMLAVGFAAALLQPALFVAQLALAALLAAAQ